ncbi:unnamed protein product [Sphagnum balticum]
MSSSSVLLLLATNVVIQVASYLKSRLYIPMTPGKINRALISMFSKFSMCINVLIVKARVMYMPASYDELANKHDAQVCNNAAMAVLKRYGIRRNDIFLSINDTTNVSITTDRLIAGMNDTCNMHLANLACDHATGKRKRTFNKEIIDLFEECEDLRLVVCRMVEYIWNKKAKLRKINYEKHNEQIGYNVIRLAMTMTRAFQATCACTNRSYATNGRYTSTSLTRNC